MKNIFRVISTRSGPFWQFWVSMIFCVTSLYNTSYPFVDWEILLFIYLGILSLPLWFSPVARWMGMSWR